MQMSNYSYIVNGILWDIHDTRHLTFKVLNIHHNLIKISSLRLSLSLGASVWTPEGDGSA